MEKTIKRAITVLVLAATAFASASAAQANGVSRVHVLNFSNRSIAVFAYSNAKLLGAWCIQAGYLGGDTVNAEVTRVRIAISTAGCTPGTMLFDQTFDIGPHDMAGPNVIFSGTVKNAGGTYTFTR